MIAGLSESRTECQCIQPARYPLPRVLTALLKGILARFLIALGGRPVRPLPRSSPNLASKIHGHVYTKKIATRAKQFLAFKLARLPARGVYKYLPPPPNLYFSSFLFLLHTYLIGVAALMNAVYDRFVCPLHIGLDEPIQHPSGF
jgi:hypothetical protein